MAQLPSTVPQLLQALRTLNPTAPRLTWYGPDSERVELSGRVLDNWVAKTANFLVDALDAEPGTVVAVDVPVHWRSLVWLLATWAVGATAVAGSGGVGCADIVATTDPAAAATSIAAARAAGTGGNPFLVAVALPALSMRWMGVLPEGAVDYSGEVRAHADEFFADDVPAADATAWKTAAGTVTFVQLLDPAAGGAAADRPTPDSPSPDSPSPAGAGPARVLLQARDGWDDVVRAALQTWAGGGSVVLLDSTVAATEHLRGTENVTRG